MRTAVLGVSLLLTVGCGGGPGPGSGPGPGPGGPGPGPTYVPTEHTLAYGVQEDVPPGTCLAIAGPYVIPAANSMSFTVDDYPGGQYDAMEAGVVRDADYQGAYGCNFYYALVDDTFTGSRSDSISAPGDTYDFIVGCSNNAYDCIFNLTWTATY